MGVAAQGLDAGTVPNYLREKVSAPRCRRTPYACGVCDSLFEAWMCCEEARKLTQAVSRRDVDLEDGHAAPSAASRSTFQHELGSNTCSVSAFSRGEKP